MPKLLKSTRLRLIFGLIVIAALVVGTVVWLAQPQPVLLSPGDDIQAVVDSHPAGTVYRLRPGVYRMQSIVPKDGDSFIGDEGAVLNGALMLENFSRDNDYWIAENVNLMSWFAGECMPEYSGCSNGEDLYFDDAPLRHVNTLEEVEPGTWFVDYDAGIVYFADDPTDHVVEISATYYAFSGTASDVTIRNLTIEKYAGPGQVSAVNGVESTNWTVADNIVRLNSGVGIGVGDGMHVLNNRVIRNGQMGVSGIGDNILVQGNEIAFNNYAGYDPGWEAGGTKFVRTNGLSVIGNYVYNNNGPGLWTDIDNINVTYADNVVVGNRSMGIFHEISYDAVIRDNVVKLNNPSPAEWFYGAQILISSSGNVEVYNNAVTVSEQGGNGITIIQQERGEGEYGAHLAIENYVHHNQIYHLGSQGASGAAGGWETGDFYDDANNRFDYNQYFVANPNHPYWGWRNAAQSWEGMQAEGQELNGSLFTNIPVDAIFVTPLRDNRIFN